MKDVKTIVYDGDVRLDVRFDGKTVWLSQQQIAELFGVGQAAISKHIKTSILLVSLRRTAHIPFWNIWLAIASIARGSTISI